VDRAVDIFPIITVVAEPVTDSDPVRDGSPRIPPDEPRRDLALWGQGREARSAWVAPRSLAPIITIQHVALSPPLDPRLVLMSAPTSEQARRYRLLRHRLLSQGDPRIIAVTSPWGGDGTTTCALNLALATAEDAMTRVLLLDANLRRPSLAKILRFSPTVSIIDNAVHVGCVGPPYPVVSISSTTLHAAPLPDAPFDGARLDRTLLATVLSELREAYDYIIIDAASVLESGDADVVAECSDGVIVALRAGRSKKREIQRAIAQLAPAPVLGSVLIDA
jgi:Mrp family chromosome partitioning ATPase